MKLRELIMTKKMQTSSIRMKLALHAILSKLKREVYKIVVIPIAIHVIVTYVIVINRWLRFRTFIQEEKTVCY